MVVDFMEAVLAVADSAVVVLVSEQASQPASLLVLLLLLLHSSCKAFLSSSINVHTLYCTLCFKIFQHASIGFKSGD